MTILLPALAAARDLTQDVRGLSNLRQIGTAAQLYSEDFDGYAVPSDLDPGNTFLTWQSYLWQRYLNRQTEVLRDAALREEAHYNPATSHAPYDQIGDVAYVMNVIRPNNTVDGWTSAMGAFTADQKRRFSGWTGVPRDTYSGSESVPVRLSRAEPAQAIYITDHRVGWSSSFMAQGMAFGVQNWHHTDHGDDHLGASAGDRRKVGLHRGDGGFNALYGDGHARFLGEGTPAEEWVAKRR
jgi:prepilin-type processing-associated H-X9-DG protein